MWDVPRGGLIGKTVHLFRAVRDRKVPLHAAGACYFLVLAVFPALVLLLSLLRYTSLEVERLTEILRGILPEALMEGAEELILLTYDKSSGTMVGFSAVTTLWSAGRGVYGMMTGLNAVYGIAETRGYFRTRLISMGYTLVFLVMLVMTLGLHILGTGVAEVMLWPQRVNFRVFLLPLVQTGVFTAMFMVLPNRKTDVWDCLPGAILASLGWLVFSRLYSIYVEHFAHLSNVYGSVYAVAVSMLWLYCCVSILFYGGALNLLVERNRR